MKKQLKFSPVKLIIFVIALGTLAYAGSVLSKRVGTLSTTSTQLTSLDKTVIGLYLDLLRTNDIKRPMSNDPTPVQFEVNPGESISDIGRHLQQQGLVKDGDLFRLYVRTNNLDSTINFGRFTLRQNMSIPEIAQTLQRGFAIETQVTIPEGKRLEEVAELLQERLNINADEFLRLARRADYNYPFLKDLPEGSSLEGYLFPDTYRLPQNPTAQDVLLKMLDNYGEKVAPLLSQTKNSGKTSRQMLTLASIVEREAVVATERPQIASVYLNRMKIGMALQADPTTQYALGYQPDQKTWWKKGLTIDDLKYSDPAGYNTYVNPDLPPGPIASPGLSSIQAVISPAQSSYLFFVASCNKDGTHQFSNSFEEHQKKLCQ
jgi:UPF0755 protein